MSIFENTVIRPPRILVAGFVYWLLFLLALEPGNIMNVGDQLVFAQEIQRIFGASFLGACSAPFLLAMVRRYPVEGDALWRNCAIEIAGCAAMAAALIAISCVLADWFLAAEQRPFLLALREEMEGNWPLVAFCTVGFAALAHTRVLRQIADDVGPQTPDEDSYIASVVVKSRGCALQLHVADIDWMETQGNYVALHCGSETHLLRTGLSALEPKLDPRRFVRTHRRIIVAIDRVKKVAALGAGDASLHLIDGTELRLSRTFRPAFLAARAAPPHQAVTTARGTAGSLP